MVLTLLGNLDNEQMRWQWLVRGGNPDTYNVTEDDILSWTLETGDTSSLTYSLNMYFKYYLPICID